MIEIKLKKGESVDRAIKRLRKKMARENIGDEMKKRRFYEKPSRKNYINKKRAKYIQRIRSKEEQY